MGILKRFLREADQEKNKTYYLGYAIVRREGGKWGWKHGGENFDSKSEVMVSIGQYIKKHSPPNDDKDLL